MAASPGAHPELKGWIGREVSYTAPEEIGRASIRYFALALGDFNPLYRDEAFASKTRHRGIIAPPTFVCETNQYMDGPQDEDGYIGHVWRLPKPPDTVLIRGGNDYQFFEPLRPSDRLTVTWRITDIFEEPTPSGPVVHELSDVRFANHHGRLLAINREENLYVRGAPENQAQGGVHVAKTNDTVAYFKDARPGHPIPGLEFALTSARMIAYGGATWDHHRYHYDADLVRSLGHLAPFVDAQLLGALLARELIDWAGPDAFLHRLAFYRQAMAYPGETLICRAFAVGTRMEKDVCLVDCSLSVVTKEGREIVTGAAATVDMPPRSAPDLGSPTSPELL